MNLNHVIEDLIETGENMPFDSWEQEIVLTLRDKVPHYSWVGFYWVVANRLILGAWDGPEATEHISIAIGDGICGLAARKGETVIVDDVNDRSEYLACFPSTKSEIVVPIFSNGEVIGEIDIDGDVAGAFGRDDDAALTRLAFVIGQKRSQHA